MKRIYLALFAVMLTMSVSAQQNDDLKNQIIQKEKTISEATSLSRQSFNELTNELQVLYVNYKAELEMQLKSKLDATSKTAKEKELKSLLEKMNN